MFKVIELINPSFDCLEAFIKRLNIPIYILY